MIRWSDYRAMRELVVEVVRRLDAPTLEGLTRFDSASS